MSQISYIKIDNTTYDIHDPNSATSSHTHPISLATSTDTSTLTLASAGKYKLTAGGNSVVFMMPTIPSAYTHPSYTAASAAAVKVGRDSTGHVVIGSSLSASDVGAASSSHTHTTSLATSTGTSTITLEAGTKYALTAGGTSVIFTMPSGGGGSGTVTSVATGTGLTGGPITESGTISLAASGVTSGSYGPSANVSPSHGGTFSVPYFTVDTYGRLTAASTKTITLPSDANNSVAQTQSSASSWRGVLGTYNTSSAAGTTPSTATNSAYYYGNVMFNPGSGILYASGDYYMGLSTSDALYTAISNAGWTSSVII